MILQIGGSRRQPGSYCLCSALFAVCGVTYVEGNRIGSVNVSPSVNVMCMRKAFKVETMINAKGKKKNVF